MSRIVLASGSPRRQELLNRIGITDFDIRVPQTDEHYPTGLTPAQIVEYISREKADAAAKLCTCLLYTSPSPRDQRGSRMPSSA